MVQIRVTETKQRKQGKKFLRMCGKKNREEVKILKNIRSMYFEEFPTRDRNRFSEDKNKKNCNTLTAKMKDRRGRDDPDLDKEDKVWILLVRE